MKKKLTIGKILRITTNSDKTFPRDITMIDAHLGVMKRG
jgi:hypothetical protein